MRLRDQSWHRYITFRITFPHFYCKANISCSHRLFGPKNGFYHRILFFFQVFNEKLLLGLQDFVEEIFGSSPAFRGPLHSCLSVSPYRCYHQTADLWKRRKKLPISQFQFKMQKTSGHFKMWWLKIIKHQQWSQRSNCCCPSIWEGL